MQTKLATWLTAFALTGATTIAAQAQQACDTYQVKRGDTLRNIARAVYGEPDITQLYRENRAAIGRNPNVLLVGTQLQIPCAVSQPLGETNTDGPSFTLITANGYAPYTDEKLDQRGLITHIVEKAMLRGNASGSAEILFVNDWAAHIESLLPRQAFDASFPWSKPGCETQGELSSSELYACQNFQYSDPLYESVEGFFALAGSGYEDAQSFELLQGATICRAEGMPTSHLEMAKLMPPATIMARPDSNQDCFDALALGKVDVVAIDTRAGDALARKMGMDFTAIENPFLQMIEPLFAAVHKDNPRADELIKTLNKGLKTMQQTGEWSSVVSKGLQQPTEVIMN